MSYIAFDLDALNVAPDVARAADLTEDRVIGGLSRLWAWCFRSATDRVTAIHIKGFFGADCTQVLSVFGFLEVDGAEFRVKGADRYLRVKEARSQNGKAAAARGNLKRGKSVGEMSPTASSTPPNSAPTEPQQASSPTPSTEHRAPNTEHRKEEVVAPSKSDSMADRFWSNAQRERVEVFKLVAERPPHPRQTSTWFNQATLSLQGDVRRLQAAWSLYCHDDFWRAKGFPWAGFVKQWEKYVPPPVRVTGSDPDAWVLDERPPPEVRAQRQFTDAELDVMPLGVAS